MPRFVDVVVVEGRRPPFFFVMPSLQSTRRQRTWRELYLRVSGVTGGARFGRIVVRGSTRELAGRGPVGMLGKGLMCCSQQKTVAGFACVHTRSSVQLGSNSLTEQGCGVCMGSCSVRIFVGTVGGCLTASVGRTYCVAFYFVLRSIIL